MTTLNINIPSPVEDKPLKVLTSTKIKRKATSKNICFLINKTTIGRMKITKNKHIV